MDDIGYGPLFQPGESDRVTCTIRGPSRRSYSKSFSGRQDNCMEYTFPDDFEGAGEMELGLYEVEWWHVGSPGSDDETYGFDTFYVVP